MVSRQTAPFATARLLARSDFSLIERHFDSNGGELAHAEYGDHDKQFQISPKWSLRSGRTTLTLMAFSFWAVIRDGEASSENGKMESVNDIRPGSAG
jgi:hypothetical protein